MDWDVGFSGLRIEFERVGSRVWGLGFRDSLLTVDTKNLAGPSCIDVQEFRKFCMLRFMHVSRSQQFSVG